MPTQYDRRDLAEAVRDALDIAFTAAREHPDQAPETLVPFLNTEVQFDEFHANVLYLRLEDQSTYRVTFVQTQPARPPVGSSARRETVTAGK